MKTTLTVLLILFTSFSMFSQVELKDENAESKLLVNNDRLIVLDFYATWCGPCKRMEPIVKELADKYGDKVDFYKINVDKSEVDDALGIAAMPTYLFIKNSSNLEQIEGAMSKYKMESLIKKHMSSSSTSSSSSYSSNSSDDDTTAFDFSDDAVNKIWNSSDKLNSLAWHAYKKREDISTLLKAIKIVERSIELEQNYYNTDTHAALLFKTGKYKEALKRAKEAINIAKKEGVSYSSTTELIEDIIDKM